MITGRHSSPVSLASVRDFAIYVVISAAVASAALVVARSDISHDALIRWGGLAVNTCVLFGYFIADSKRLFGRVPFWILTACLLLAHLAIFGIVLHYASKWRLVCFLVMYLEAPILMVGRDRCFVSSHD
jgi:hypothetical protein